MFLFGYDIEFLDTLSDMSDKITEKIIIRISDVPIPAVIGHITRYSVEDISKSFDFMMKYYFWHEAPFEII